MYVYAHTTSSFEFPVADVQADSAGLSMAEKDLKAYQYSETEWMNNGVFLQEKNPKQPAFTCRWITQGIIRERGICVLLTHTRGIGAWAECVVWGGAVGKMKTRSWRDPKESCKGASQSWWAHTTWKGQGRWACSVWSNGKWSGMRW